jgi:hypothetical protein
VPQITAIADVASVAGPAGVSVIADGGIRHSGDIPRPSRRARLRHDRQPLRRLRGEPGETVIHKGRSYKVYRGMGSEGAMVRGSKERYGQGAIEDKSKLVPEGRRRHGPFKGSSATSSTSSSAASAPAWATAAPRRRQAPHRHEVHAHLGRQPARDLHTRGGTSLTQEYLYSSIRARVWSQGGGRMVTRVHTLYIHTHEYRLQSHFCDTSMRDTQEKEEMVNRVYIHA